MLKFYVYAYLRSKNSETAKAGTPYYIGKGTGSRAWKHCSTDAIHPPNDNSLIVVLEDHLTELGAFALERRMIRWYGRIDQSTGILRNGSDGGQGGAYWLGKKRLNSKPRKLKERITVFNICKNCKTEFTREFSIGNKRQFDILLYCSASCRNKDISKYRKHRSGQPWNKGKKTGIIPWNKGKKSSEETKHKSVISRLGKKICYNTISGKQKLFAINDIPDGWVIGKVKSRLN